MAKLFGGGDYPYVFKEVTSKEGGYYKNDKFDEFCNQILPKFDGYSIAECSVYESQLKSASKRLMHVPMPFNWRIRHEFLILELEASNNRKYWISLEKGPDGVLMQSGSSEAALSQQRFSIVKNERKTLLLYEI